MELDERFYWFSVGSAFTIVTNAFIKEGLEADLAHIYTQLNRTLEERKCRPLTWDEFSTFVRLMNMVSQQETINEALK